MNERFSKTQMITMTGVLSALIIIVSFLPLKTMGLEVTFSMVPVAIGAIVFGPTVGAILGCVFGLVSFLQCFGYSAFGATLLGMSATKTFLVCVPTRILAGYLTGLIRKALQKYDNLSILISSFAAPVMNTLFFMTLLIVFFYKTEYLQGFVKVLNAPNPVVFLFLFVGINAVAEIVLGIIIAYPAAKTLSKVLK